MELGQFVEEEDNLTVHESRVTNAQGGMER